MKINIKKGNMMKNIKHNKAYSLIKNLFIWIIVIPSLLYIVVIIYFPIFDSLSPVFFEFRKPIIKFLLTIILLPIFYRYIRAYFKRVSFVRNLKKICSNKSFKFVQMKNPYIALFKKSTFPEIAIQTKDKIYILHMFHCLKRCNSIVFLNSSIITINHVLLKSLPTIRTNIKYGFESIQIPKEISEIKPVERIMILNPVPYKTFLQTKKGTILCDNNEKMFDFTLYTGTGFCNMIDRLY